MRKILMLIVALAIVATLAVPSVALAGRVSRKELVQGKVKTYKVAVKKEGIVRYYLVTVSGKRDVPWGDTVCVVHDFKLDPRGQSDWIYYEWGEEFAACYTFPKKGKPVNWHNIYMELLKNEAAHNYPKPRYGTDRRLSSKSMHRARPTRSIIFL